MTPSSKLCSSCRTENQISARYCARCGGANFDMQPLSSPLEMSPPPVQNNIVAIDMNSPTTRGDIYLSSIALYLRVYWLFFLGFLVGALTGGLGFAAMVNAPVKCDYYSCNPNYALAIFIYAVGGLTTLGIYIAGIVSGFKASSRVLRAEKI